MRTELIVIDEIYDNVDDVRKFALKQNFDKNGNYPGKRTKSFISGSIEQTFKDALFPSSGNVLRIDGGEFQITTCLDRTWIHHDGGSCKWAAVIYLTPDAPHTSGTGFYRLKSNGKHKTDNQENQIWPHNDYTKWDLFDVIGNKYNRLILYRSDLFHAALDYFGDSLENGRLFQTFFIETEY